MKRLMVFTITLTLLALTGGGAALAAGPLASASGSLTGSWLEEEPQACDFGCSSGCSSGCSGICCCYDPKWTVGAGAIFLRRNDPTPRTLLINRQDGSELMNTMDLAPGWGAGPRLEITRHFQRGMDFEIELFNIDNWANSASAQNATPSIGERFWDAFTFDDVRAYYGTDLFNLEFNFRWPLFGSPWLKGLAGLRYASLNEQFMTAVTLDVDGTTLSNWGRLNLNNNLYGVQIGLEPVFWNPRGPLRVDGYLKTGLYGNHAEWLLTAGGDLEIRLWDKKGCHTAFIGELGLKATYDFCRCRCQPCCGGSEGCGDAEGCGQAACCSVCRRWSVFAGYEALWLSGVATAEQEKLFIRYDTAFYHGAVVGIEIPLGRLCCRPKRSYPCD